MPTVNRMEIEGTMHDIEDTEARSKTLVPVMNSDNEITALTPNDETARGLADTKARESVTGIDDRLTTAETTIETLSGIVESLNTVDVFGLPASAVNTDVLSISAGYSAGVVTIGNLQIFSGAAVFSADGPKENVRLFTLPEGYRPKWTIEGTAFATTGNQPLRFWVEPTGDVYAFNSAAVTGGYIFFNAVYPKA